MKNIYLLYKSADKIKFEYYTILNVKKDISPFSFFNFIFINNSGIDESDIENIITHELVHVTQKHSFDVILLELFCILMWFNPLTWLYKKALKENHEFLADESALNKIISAEKYKLLLLSSSIGTYNYALTNNFSQSLTKKRFKMMSKKNKSNKSVIIALMAIPILVLFLFNSFAFNSNNMNTYYNLMQGKDSVYFNVEEMPEFPGGDEAFQMYIASNVVYPEIAKKLGVNAKVIIGFVVDEVGNVVDVEVKRSAAKAMDKNIGTGEKPTKYDAALALDAEAVRVFSSLPKWKPGKNVKVQYTAPINFNLK